MYFFLWFRRTKTQHYWGNRRYGRCTSAFPQGSLCQSQRWCPRSFTAKWDRLFRSWKDEFSFANHVAWIAIRLHLCSFSCFPMETLHSFYQTKRLRLIHCVSEFCQSKLLFERRCLCVFPSVCLSVWVSFCKKKHFSVQNGSNSQIRWTDISNSRIQARRAWFLVSYKVLK